MRKATEANVNDDKEIKFQQLAKTDLKQDTIRDFVSYTTDGTCIALLGSKSELVTLELTAKTTYHAPFPYTVHTFQCSKKIRPLDTLSQQVDLQHIYDNSNVLEIQQLSLEPAYTAPCSQDVPAPNLIAAKWAPQPLPDGSMLLATLNSYGAVHLLTKSKDQPLWREYELGVDVAATLRDTLQPPYDVPAAKIDSFRRYQPFIDRSWITMFTWRTEGTVLVLGTASGSLWTLTLSADAKTIQAHTQLQTLLDRICYLQGFDDLLLVGDNSGLVHLYRFSPDEEDGLCLVKTLWLRPDRMGLQQAIITPCSERACYYIVCCKAAHLLIWCMPRKQTGTWLDTHLYVGGMKITGLCALENYSYAISTARGQLHRIELSHMPAHRTAHKSAQLSASMQPIVLEDVDNFQPFGLISSPQKNLLTILLAPNNEYLLNKSNVRDELLVSVGKLQRSDALTQLASCLSPKVFITDYVDLLIDIRLHIMNRIDVERYVNYAPFDHFAFDELATDKQLEQLQLKYHVLDIMNTQTSQPAYLLPVEQTESAMYLLLTMLSLTHIRLRLQYLSKLKKLTAFQRKAAGCLLGEGARIRQNLEQQLTEEHPLNVTRKRMLSQMEVHFEKLQLKFDKPDNPPANTEEQLARCSISCLQLTPTLERQYCTLCERQVLLKRQLLLELYAADTVLHCPYCHGPYALEQFDA